MRLVDRNFRFALSRGYCIGVMVLLAIAIVVMFVYAYTHWECSYYVKRSNYNQK